MADAQDLATLNQVKSYMYSGQPLSTLPSTDDFIISPIITAVSTFIARYLGRQSNDINFLLAQTWSEVRNGFGTTQLKLMVKPLISVTSVTLGNTVISSVQGQLQSGFGYVWDSRSNMIYLRGFVFPWGAQTSQIVYTAGYNTPGMSALAQLPAWAMSTPYGLGAQINQANVIYTAIVAGTSGGSPPVFPTTQGATVSDGSTLVWEATGVAVPLVAGAFLPPLRYTTACVQETALIYKQRDRWGDTGFGVGPEHISYFMKDMHPTTKMLLEGDIDWSASVGGGEVTPYGGGGVGLASGMIA